MAVFTIQSEEILIKENRTTTTMDSTDSEEGVMDILRSTVMVKRIVILMTAWYIRVLYNQLGLTRTNYIIAFRFACVMSYYGITFAANNISSKFYINYELIM
jgi:hypothetical protein